MIARFPSFHSFLVLLGNLLFLVSLISQTSLAFQSNALPEFSNITVKRSSNQSMATVDHHSLRRTVKNKLVQMRNNKGDQPQDEMMHNNNQIMLTTTKQKGEVLLYRLALISASTAYTCNLLSTGLVTSDSGAGLSLDFLYHLQNSSHVIFTWGILLAALVAPPNLGAVTDTSKKNDFDNALFLLLNELLPTLSGFAIIAEVVNKIQENLSDKSTSLDSLDNIAMVLITLICFREVRFFGASYKAEAIFAIFCAVILALNELIGFSESALSGGLSLSLLVLSFGKIFEPLRDDLQPNQSAFFQDDRI